MSIYSLINQYSQRTSDSPPCLPTSSPPSFTPFTHPSYSSAHRELAIQISEQFGVLGAAMGVRVALVIGGMNMMKQGAELARRPHIVIATPGHTHATLYTSNIHMLFNTLTLFMYVLPCTSQESTLCNQYSFSSIINCLSLLTLAPALLLLSLLLGLLRHHCYQHY